MFLQLALSSLAWATAATVISLGLSLLVIWWLGLHIRKLAAEIADVQNTAVGALFFVISLITSIFVGVLAGGVPTQSGSGLEELAWIVGGVAVAAIYMLVIFWIAHREMGPKGETLRQWVHREIITEQNAALAFFLGALAVPPFIAVLYQII